jgi:hypothetical protein
MRASSFAGQVVAVLSRRTAAFQPGQAEPSTFPGALRAYFTGKRRRAPGVAPAAPGDWRRWFVYDPARVRLAGRLGYTGPLEEGPEGSSRLPRLDRAGFMMAGTSSAARPVEVTTIGDVQYTQSDLGGDLLEIVVVTENAAEGAALQAVTVTMPDRSVDYLLVFIKGSRGWVAALRIPGLGEQLYVTVRSRERSSLDHLDVDAISRSVRAVADPWIPAWQELASEREAGDPVRTAVEDAL